MPNPTAPTWKQAMLILLALFPLVMLETFYFYPYLTAFNTVLTRFCGVILIVCCISYIFMPATFYLLGWWLHPRSAKHEYTGLFIVLSLYVIEICFFLLIA
jgi:antibiotic biosynthesis monooxygenase (ABM) superfamily enzyme